MALPATNLATSGDVLSQCMSEAVAQAPGLMAMLVDKALVVLRAREAASTDMRERITFGDSADVLARELAVLQQHFPIALESVLQAAMRPEAARTSQQPAVAPEAGNSLRFEHLELLDDHQMQGRIEAARMQQTATAKCERELAELDALVSTVRGLPSIQANRNPFRPVAFSTALAEALAQTTASAEQQLEWLQALGAHLSDGLRTLYQSLIDKMRVQKVQAATYSFTGSTHNAGTGSGGGSSQGARSGAVPGAARSGTSQQLTIEQLRSVVSGNVGPRAAQVATGAEQTSAAADEVMDDLDALQAVMQQMGIHTDMRARSVMGQASEQGSDDAMQADEEVATEMAEAAPYTSQAEAVAEKEDIEANVAHEVVSMLVDNICHDPRLLPRVVAWIRTLEAPLQALVSVDNGFFNDKGHPARRLLDDVTERSLGFANEEAEGFESFFDPVERACVMLRPHAMPDAQPFVQAWVEIEKAWADQRTQALKLQQELAVQALLEVEQRNLLADKIALELTRRDDCRLAPIFVKQFLAGPWAQVLAKARLSPALVAQAGRYVTVLDDLLWSVWPAQRSKARLVRMIPSLLTTLREGLASVGSPASANEAFFTQLMQLHELAMKAQPQPVVMPAATNVATPEATPAVSRDAVEEELTYRDADAVWMAPQEAKNSGFMDESDAVPPSTLPADFDDQIEPTVPQALEAVGQADRPAMEPPSLGSWVEFASEDKWVRAQLTWASPHGTLFMFTGAAGRPYSMTRRALDKMQVNQSMRLIAGDGVVGNALDALAQTALRNTLRH
jgi:hypothetical protein